MIDVENLQVEVQARANALTGTPTDEQVIEVGIAARSVELAGGVINRTVLDVAIQNVIDGVSGVDANADLIALGATLPRTISSGTAGGPEVGTYVTGLFKGNPKYLQCNNSTYLRSAYPELTDLMLSNLTQQVSISASEATNISSVASSYETQTSVYKVNSKYYKLLGGVTSTASWTTIPIQWSSDGINYVPIMAPSMDNPIIYYGSNYQMDTLVAVGTTLLAFGRLLANGIHYLIQLKSQNDGKTWVFSSIRSVTDTSNYSSIAAPVLAAIIGNTVMVHPRGESASNVFYSTNLGTTWSAVTDTDVAVNSKFINGLVQDGTRFIVGFSDGSSAYSATSNPSGTTWTAVTPPNANAKGVLAVVSGKWIMGGSSGYVATCTTPGTWVAETVCTGGMPTLTIERISVNGSVIAFSRMSALSQVFFCTDASTLPIAAAVAEDAVAANPTKLCVVSVSDGNFYVRQGTNSLIRSVTLASNSFTAVQSVLSPSAVFDSVNYGTVKKFGLYFYSVGGAGQNHRYVSSDMKNWRLASSVIATGCGAVVDAGTRLLALDDNQLLWQSTDGIVWNTTGITRPTLGGTVYGAYARLFVCANNWIYYGVFRNDASSYTFYVSKNNGSTWTAVTSLSMAGYGLYTSVLENPCLFKEINGKIYSLSVNYFSSGYGYYLSRSTDGVAFTYVTGVADTMVGVPYSRRNGIFEVDGVIYVAISGDTTVWLASYDDGVNFSTIHSSFAPTQLVEAVGPSANLLVNNLSSEQLLLLKTTSLVQLSGTSLTKSPNYDISSSNLSTMLVYESGTLKLVTQVTASPSLVAPKLISLVDANITFTLPSISNTWLRATA